MQSLESKSDSRLVELCLRKNAAAWEVLVRRHRRRVFNIAYQFVGLPMVAAAFAVSAQNPGAARVDELRGRDVAGVGTFLCNMHVLATDRDRAAGKRLMCRSEEGM